ncbi:uncharacterized protein HaLaN_15084, partial [Haematococcus lacustris]
MSLEHARALQLYEVVWSQGKVNILDDIMAEHHEQLDMATLQLLVA